MSGLGGMDQTKCVAKLARLITEAPAEPKIVLNKVKMTKSKAENLKSLGAPVINKEMLAMTLGHLRNINVDDESITMLLKDGKKHMIIREVMNLMPFPCVTCHKDAEFQAGDNPQVRCRSCRRGACKACFTEPQNGWVYLCSRCDKNVQKEQEIPEALLTVKKKKTTSPTIATQNAF